VLNDGRSVLRLLLTGLVALALVVAGVAIGATLWPRMVTVERHVIAPAVRAVTRDSGSVADLVDADCPAVVAIEPADPIIPLATDMKNERKSAHGNRAVDLPPPRLAGFLVSADGSVLTSTAFLPTTGDLTVLINDGRRLNATRVGADPVSGLALLKLEGSDFPFLQLATAGFPRTGDSALALSSPNGSGCFANAGGISADFVAEQGSQRGYLRMAPAIPAALAGTPVAGADGRVLGIAGLGLTLDGGDTANTAATEDASLLLPASTASRVLSELLRNGQPTPNPLGLYVEDLTTALASRLGATRQRGAVVMIITPGSPASGAGVRAGDIIVSVNGAPIAGASELARAMNPGDDEVTVDILRRTGRITLKIGNADSGAVHPA
jgi:serine protease Do